jgi:hypothetical protein
MSNSKEDVIKRYVSDMIALERYVKQAAESQLEKGRFAGHMEGREVVRKLRTTSSEHLDRLGEELGRLGGEPTKTIKETVAGAAGSVVELFQRLRTEQESKMLRDHYATLGVIRMGYIALHTTGLALNHPEISGMALRHLADLSPLVPELEEAMVKLVPPELREEVSDVEEGVVDKAVEAIQESRKAA